MASKDPSRFSLRLFQGILPLSRRSTIKDALAGFQLAAMNVPQALGYTKIAGMPLVTGFYTLLLPLLTFAVFGSSRYLVVAADSATAAILAGGLSSMAPLASARYMALASMVALLTAGFLLLARLLRLGFLADFLSQTVLIGFLTGVGVQVGIAVSGTMLGIEIHSHRTVLQLIEVISNLPHVHLLSALISALVLTVIFACHRFAPKVPGPLLAVLGAIVASEIWDFAARGVVVVGPVTGGLPHLALPDVRFSDILPLVGVSASCFVMIVAQSAATSRFYAGRHHQEVNEDEDLVGLAAANTAAALSGTFVVNGSPTQTAMVESSGGQSQMAQVSTAILVALVLLLLTKPLQYLPHCVLGAVVFFIAVRLIDLSSLRDIKRESPGEYALALLTAAIVVLVGVEQGILVAMVLSLLRVVRHSYEPHTGVLVASTPQIWRSEPAVPGTVTEPGLVIYRFGAPLFYANVHRFVREIQGLASTAGTSVRWLVVDAEAISNVDYTAAHAVRRLKQFLTRNHVELAIARAGASLQTDLVRHLLMDAIGPQWMFPRIHDALHAFSHAQNAAHTAGPEGTDGG